MSEGADDKTGWSALPYADWAETCTALHLWTEIVGKYRLAHTPWVNHSWHATLYVTPRGLSTGAVPDGETAILTEVPEWETWLTAPWAEANAMQRPLPDGALRIVARGEKEDALPA